MDKKYVWLNMNTGEFSHSWNEDMQRVMDNELLKRAKDLNWKCIEYTCLNDESFSFYNLMKIVTNKTNQND